MDCTIIAEAGVNHNGDLDKARRLCQAAKDAGADIVKFQTYVPEKCIRRGKDYDLLANLALPLNEFRGLAQFCEMIDIEFCSTPDDLDSLKFLVEHCGVKRIKLGSGSLLYEPLVDAAFDTGLPILLSTGMATVEEVRKVWERQRTRAVPINTSSMTSYNNKQSMLMHCVSLYPCPARLANISAMHDLGYISGRVGYSDHTIGDYAVLSAVANGALAIEKHFTIDNEADGPDHRMSAMPEQFERLVMKIRMVEEVLGHGCKEPSQEELAMIPRIRKDAEGFQPGL